MEDIARRTVVDLHIDGKKKKRCIKNPRFKCTKDFNQELSAFLMRKATVKLDKPLYVGQAILDVSKICMYKFFYNDVRQQYPNAKMLYTDTDSFFLSVETNDFYEEIDVAKYDTSNFPEDHPRYSSANKKVVGLPKDEGAGKPIAEFAVLRSKSYCVRFEEKEAKRHKGVKKYVVKTFTFDMYKRCLDSGRAAPKCQMTVIGQRLHEIKTQTLTKKTLSAFDDKRYYTDSINSLAHGHYKIDELLFKNAASYNKYGII